MKPLTRNEEIFLICIWRLDKNAYGVKIRETIMAMTGKSLLIGSLYNTLDQLVKKEYVSTYKGEPTIQRGGQNKIYYSLTSKGKEALDIARQLHNTLWRGIPENTFIKQESNEG